MKSLERSKVLSCTCLYLLTLQTVCAQLYGSPAYMTPPLGNSPSTLVTTTGGYIVYTCVNGAWKAGNVYATLLQKSTNRVVGNYTRRNDQFGPISTWTLFNSPGDYAESGNFMSMVSGRPIESFNDGSVANLPTQLFEAVSHENFGQVASVSYAQIYNINGGAPPPTETCSSTVFSKSVPFNAEFCLWNQDRVPAAVPMDLSCPGRMVEGFFANGYVSYLYTGSGWVDSGKTGLLYGLPGTAPVGNFWGKDGIVCLDIYDPNGFAVYGAVSSSDRTVSGNAYAWSLSTVTSESGSLSFIGPFSHVQMISTRGGMPPGMSSSLVVGTIANVQFSSIYWLFQPL